MIFYPRFISENQRWVWVQLLAILAISAILAIFLIRGSIGLEFWLALANCQLLIAKCC